MTSLVEAQVVPTPDHVVVVIYENHAFQQIIGSTDAPYINSLATDPYAALFTQSHGVTHPSQPNYLYLFSGSSQNVILDFTPFSWQLPFTTDNLGAQLLFYGKTFCGYSEDLPSVGFTGDTYGQYARKHSPWINWQDGTTNGIPAALNQPLTSFPTNFNNLPTVSFVIPNLDHDMHDGSVAAGDAWLQTHIDAYAQWCKTHNSLLIFTYDEDDDVSGNRITTIFLGQMVKAGQYSESFDHNTTLRTVEDMYGLGHVGGSSSVNPITDCWVYRPVSAMRGAPLTICPGQDVQFTDTSANTPTAWNWTFPGGSPASSTQQNPVVHYNTAGTYAVTLVTSNHMGTDTLLRTNYITVNSNPHISLNIDSISICNGDVVNLTASGAGTYNWVQSTGTVNANHLTATLTADQIFKVTGSTNGCAGDTATAIVTINQTLVPSIQISSTQGNAVCAGTINNFSSTITNGGSGATYQWKFNGGNVGTGDSVFSVYASGPSYTVACVLSSTESCANPHSATSNVVTVTVNNPTSASVSQSICQGSAYQLGQNNYTESGTYTATLIGSNGCDSVVTLHLTVNASPQPVINANGGALVTGNFTSYQWLQDEIPLTGQTAATFTPNSNGMYQVIVSDANGCVDTSAVYDYEGLGIDGNAIDFGIRLIPNPTKGDMQVVMNNALAGKLELRLFDLAGRLVLERRDNVAGGLYYTNIDMRAFSAGIYTLRITNGANASTQKVVITK